MRIRQGNDFIFLWAIERSGLPEDFSNAVNIRLHFKNFDCIGEVKSFQIVDGNIVRVEVSPEWASRLGAYRLILSYEFENNSYSDGDRKCVVDVLAFNIVSRTSDADDVTEMAKTTDIMIGLKGDKGDPFTYEDFTQQQLDAIQQPITDFVAVAEVAENQREINEGVRIQADLLREQRTNTAIQAVTDAQIESEEVISEALNDFNTRVEVVEDAEVIREQNEQDRQTNTATAITNAENAITDVNAAKNDYYDVVKPAIQIQGEYATAQGDYAKAQGEAIQDDLALKANHGYESNPKTLKEVDDEKADHGYASIAVAKTLKEVEDNASVKIENLVVNGDFRNGTAGWTAVAGNLSYTNRVLSATGNGTVSAIRVFSQIVVKSSNKYYFKGKIRTLSSLTTAFTTMIRSTVGAATISNITVFSSPVQNQWNDHSGILTATATFTTGVIYITSEHSSKENANGSVMQLDGDYGVKVVNLTEAFGEGNEPTKEEMDLLISTLGIDYFEGEITIPAQKVMQWQLKLIRKNKNAIIALGGTII